MYVHVVDPEHPAVRRRKSVFGTYSRCCLPYSRCREADTFFEFGEAFDMAVARSGLPLLLFLVLGTAFSLTIGKPKSLSTDAEFSKEAFLKKCG